MSKESKSVIKNFPAKKSAGSDGFIVKFPQEIKNYHMIQQSHSWAYSQRK